MSLCQEVGRWVEEDVIKPVERFFEELREQCREVSRWVEREIRTPIETWREQEEKRCREQECNWLCLCCNKWFCWIVTVLVKVIEWVIKVVGEWLIETICTLIVEIIRVIVLVVVTVLKWVVEFVVCIVEQFCKYLYLAVGVALIALLVGLVMTTGALTIAVLPALLVSAIAAGSALLLALVLCERSLCRLIGVVVWALKWSIVFGAGIAVATLNLSSAFVVVLLGGMAATLIWMLIARRCRVPEMFDAP